MTVSVVYVNFNTGGLLIDSLRSLRHVEFDLEVIVVDNASEREPLDASAVEEAWPGAKIVWSPENVGFGRGCNLGVEIAAGDPIWLLNTDTVVGPDNRLDDLVRWLLRHDAYGAALPLLLNEDGTVQSPQVGRLPVLWRMIVETAVRPVRSPLHRFGIAYGDSNERDVEDAAAAALFIRTHVYRRIGGFDPIFFFFCEDHDLNMRIGRAGYLIRHYVDAQVTHLFGQSIADKQARRKMWFDSLNIYFRKWRPEWERRTLRIIASARRRRAI